MVQLDQSKSGMDCGVLVDGYNSMYAVYHSKTNMVPYLVISHFCTLGIFFDFSLTVKAAPHECLIRTGQH